MIMTNVVDSGTKREAIATHELIAAAGGEHTDMQSAIGIRYTDKASGESFEFLLPDAKPGTPLTMLALFGAKTKATNETSRVRNGTGGDYKAQLEALDEVFESISNGVWREKAEGGGGSRTDKNLLARILIAALGEQAKGDEAFYVARMTDEKGYIRKILSNDTIKDEYRKQSGKTSIALDTLA
jgi:hypothetical protein